MEKMLVGLRWSPPTETCHAFDRRYIGGQGLAQSSFPVRTDHLLEHLQYWLELKLFIV